MKRREFVKFLAGSTIWPALAASAGPPLPVIGFLGFEAVDPKLLTNFQQGLGEWGYIEGRNVAIQYRWGLGQNQALPELATELAQQRVALIVASGGLAAARAAREATTTIPILFTTVLDPVVNGFLSSFNRPGGNATGLSVLNTEMSPKRLELLQKLVPQATRVAYLFNDDHTGLGPVEEFQLEAYELVASRLGLAPYRARNKSDIKTAFAAMARQQTEALVVGSDPLFGHQRALIAALAAQYALPAVYSRREFADAGGLMSYGPSMTEAWRQLGEYAGRILKGARPQELPVRLHNQYELVINMKTAKMLGLTVPPLLHALADDVVE